MAAEERRLQRINMLCSLRNFYRQFPNTPAGFRLGVYGHVELDGPTTPATALRALHAAFDERPQHVHPTMPVPDAPQPLRNPHAA
jgi:hypothetical protein